MKVLIIGNGFDLAHGLPTKYSDFLDFVHCYRMAFHPDNSEVQYDTYEKYVIEPSCIDERVQKRLKELYCNWKSDNDAPELELLEKFYADIDYNIWFDYLYARYQQNNMKGENWIDFESEISDIISWLDNNTKYQSDDIIPLLDEMDGYPEKITDFLERLKSCDWIKDTYSISVEKTADRLYHELRKLTEALEIYLSVIVENIHVEALEKIKEITPDRVISFNYTNTFKRVYGKDVDCYIHGKCRHGEEYSQKNCSLVLGIDEYWHSDNDKDTRTNFAMFKKFTQRIRYHNDTRYMAIAAELKRDVESWDYYEKSDNSGQMCGRPRACSIGVFGHSLDITDKDILQMFLKPNLYHVSFYPKDDMDEGKLIQNLISTIGEDSLIEKSSAYPPEIEFLDDDYDGFEEYETDEQKKIKEFL